MNARINPDWIAVDWGTSNVRAWAMSNTGEILAEASSGDGMGTLQRDAFEPAFLKLASSWLQNRPPIIACGMVGSRQGWQEAPYRAVPATPCGKTLTHVNTIDPRLSVHLISGLKQTNPADVMRGEETQIAGLIAADPTFDGIVCLPGTHTKWARVSAEECVSFQTFMTGELFSQLSERSVLRHSVQSETWDEAAFCQSVDEAISKPEKLAARLFSLRAEFLLNDLPAASARARLSGLLIGSELAAARPYWLGQEIAIVGAKDLSSLYATALRQLGCDPKITAAENLTLAGLSAAYLILTESTK